MYIIGLPAFFDQNSSSRLMQFFSKTNFLIFFQQIPIGWLVRGSEQETRYELNCGLRGSFPNFPQLGAEYQAPEKHG